MLENPWPAKGQTCRCYSRLSSGTNKHSATGRGARAPGLPYLRQYAQDARGQVRAAGAHRRAGLAGRAGHGRRRDRRAAVPPAGSPQQPPAGPRLRRHPPGAQASRRDADAAVGGVSWPRARPIPGTSPRSRARCCWLSGGSWRGCATVAESAVSVT